MELNYRMVAKNQLEQIYISCLKQVGLPTLVHMTSCMVLNFSWQHKQTIRRENTLCLNAAESTVPMHRCAHACHFVP